MDFHLIILSLKIKTNFTKQKIMKQYILNS